MHNDFNEEKIEQLLLQAPKFEDTRSKEDVLNRLKAEGLFKDDAVHGKSRETVDFPSKKKIPYKWIGTLVAAAAALAIIPTMLSNSNDMVNEAGNSEVFEMASNKADGTSLDEETSGVESFSTGVTAVRMMDLRQNLYVDELLDERVFTFGLTSNDAESVPFSMKLTLPNLMEYGLTEDSTYLELYKTIAPLIDEESLGFRETHPLVGELSEDGKKLIHKLPTNHPYDGSSAKISNYIGLMQDTFGGHYEEVILQDENGNEIALSEVGEIQPIKLTGLGNRMNYFVYTNDLGVSYLSPNFRKTFDTVEDAIDGLRNEWNDVYQSAMIDDIKFKTIVYERYVEIVFDETLDVTEYPADDLMKMLEALILTVTSFDYDIKFSNVEQQEWSGFQFTEILPTVKGVNEIAFYLP